MEVMIDAQTELCESSDSVHTWGVKYFTPHVCTESELSHSSVCASIITSKCTPTLIRVQRLHTLPCLAPRVIVAPPQCSTHLSVQPGD